MTTKPNILVIMSDEHDAAVTGCYGDGVVRTPRLDGLAASGVTFDACYCNSPLCVPSRLSFTAGRYVSRVSAWQNTASLPADDIASLPRLLRRAGYAPYLCGKQHYDARRRYGFIDLDPRFNQGRKRGIGEHRAPGDRRPGAVGWHQRAADFHPGDHSHTLDHDRRVTATASRFLADYDPAQGPFFLFAGYLAPHFPLIAPEDIVAHYRGRVPPPIPPNKPFERQPLNLQHHQLGFGTTLCSEGDLMRGRELYWALTDWFDREVGQLLDTLAASAAAEDTIVIYTSDHGENKGDHGLWWKNCMYDHGARVPLIVSWPARWAGGQRRSAPCSLVDLVQTIVALAGEDAPADWDGDSMLPWLDDADYAWKGTALSEYYGHNVCSGMTMYRRGRHKYIYHARIDGEYPAERELYDLAADPHEQHDLAADPAHADLAVELHAAMLAELGEHPDEIEQRCRRELAAGYDDDLRPLYPTAASTPVGV